MISVIIPARRERFLDRTIKGIQENFRGDFEIIVTLDGHNAKRLDGVTYIYNKEFKGMRTAINQAVAVAEGKYIMKLDAHCMVDEGIDLKLIAEHQDKWVQIPTRKRLDPRKWELTDIHLPDVDYMRHGKNFIGFKSGTKNRDPELKKKLLDDAMTFQGSCYFMERDFFNELGLLDDVNFNGNGHEAQEVCFKVRRAGGRIVRNKKTWYAHARTNRFYTTDRTKSREYIKVLAEECDYKNN